MKKDPAGLPETEQNRPEPDGDSHLWSQHHAERESSDGNRGDETRCGTGAVLKNDDPACMEEKLRKAIC